MPMPKRSSCTTMHKNSLTSNNSSRRRQKAAERTNINLLRYMLDHPGTTCKGVAEDLGMSLPNVFRLVAGFKESGIVTGSEQKQTGKRGPWSQVISLRADLGCTIGVDLEATRIRGVILDFANNITDVTRQPLSPTDGPEEIVSAVAEVADQLVRTAHKQKIEVSAVGLGLPGPVTDMALGRVRTELQFGKETMEFIPLVEGKCGIPTSAAANSYCFTIGHHRMHKPRGTGIEMVVLNRFGLAAALMWNGQLYTGASHYAGDLGLLPCGSGDRRYRDVCTGASLLKWARERNDERPFQELLQSPDDPLVREWLEEAVPGFAHAICAAIIIYNPDSVLIEGIFNKLPEETRGQIAEIVTEEVKQIGNMLPEIKFFEGDDLMGARGAALLARDGVADDVLGDMLQAL